MARGLARNAQIWHELYRPNSRQRTVAAKTQAGPNAALSPVPRATIRCGFWIFCGMQPIVAAILGDECWMRRYPRCPRWGWCSAQRIKIIMIAGGNHTSVSCREAAKGVSLVILSRCHSTSRTPSVSPYGLPAPPPGSQGMRQTSPERGGGATAPEGSGAVRRIPIGMHQGEFVQAPLASPGGVAERSESFNNNDCRWQSYLDLIAGSLDGSSEPMKVTDEGRRQPKHCLHSVQWHQSKIIADYCPLFRFIYHMENDFYKASTFPHSSNSL